MTTIDDLTDDERAALAEIRNAKSAPATEPTDVRFKVDGIREQGRDAIKALDNDGAGRVRFDFSGHTFHVQDLGSLDMDEALDLLAKLGGEHGVSQMKPAVARLLADGEIDRLTGWDFRRFMKFTQVMATHVSEVLGTPGE